MSDFDKMIFLSYLELMEKTSGDYKEPQAYCACHIAEFVEPVLGHVEDHPSYARLIEDGVPRDVVKVQSFPRQAIEVYVPLGPAIPPWHVILKGNGGIELWPWLPYTLNTVLQPNVLYRYGDDIPAELPKMQEAVATPFVNGNGKRKSQTRKAPAPKKHCSNDQKKKPGPKPKTTKNNNVNGAQKEKPIQSAKTLALLKNQLEVARLSENGEQSFVDIPILDHDQTEVEFANGLVIKVNQASTSSHQANGGNCAYVHPDPQEFISVPILDQDQTEVQFANGLIIKVAQASTSLHQANGGNFAYVHSDPQEFISVPMLDPDQTEVQLANGLIIKVNQGITSEHQENGGNCAYIDPVPQEFISGHFMARIQPTFEALSTGKIQTIRELLCYSASDSN